MKTNKINLILMVLFSGISALTYTSEPMEIDFDDLSVFNFRCKNNRNKARGKLHIGMRYDELSIYLSGLLGLPADTHLRVFPSDNQSRYIDLWKNPEYTLSKYDFGDMVEASVVNILHLKK